MVSSKKSIKKSSWGGNRENAGRQKKYEPIKLKFKLDSEENIVKLLKLIPQWILEDKLPTYKARALTYSLKTIIEKAVPLDRMIELAEDVCLILKQAEKKGIISPNPECENKIKKVKEKPIVIDT